MAYTTNEEIKNCLLKNYSGSTSTASVEDLLKWWTYFVSRVDSEGDIDEYWNDLTVRKAIADIQDFVNPEEKETFLKELDQIDEEFKTKTIELENPFREGEEEKYDGPWFHFRAPEYLVRTEKFIIKKP
ncbi:MAG: hypothetical protein RL141_131 [Candidatus Parcubacteria bacterium]|jgi:hypothetical protein